MGAKQKGKTRQKTVEYVFPQKFYELSSAFTSSFYKPVPEPIIEGHIITIDHLFTSEFCNELIADFSKNLTLETTPNIKSKEYAARVNDRVLVTSFSAADALWKYIRLVLTQTPEYENLDLEKIRATFLPAKSLNPQLRIYRYTKGHHFGMHYDDSVTCPLAHDPNVKGKTKWTLLIYLTGDDEFSGGGTIFYSDYRDMTPLNIHPSKGMALLHKHGSDCMRHEAELVKSGIKWVLRSDVSF